MDFDLMSAVQKPRKRDYVCVGRVKPDSITRRPKDESGGNRIRTGVSDILRTSVCGPAFTVAWQENVEC